MSYSFRDERAGERDGGGGGRRRRRDRLRRVRQNDPEILNEVDEYLYCRAAVATLKSNVYLVIDMYYITRAYIVKKTIIIPKISYIVMVKYT
jgi:hypothetical protein